ncbi:hypothetical protein SEPCBS119000_004942 [Sporothrix epigloea]|uniref:SprT-like domain-containing protein n=1 Tax=Sporothrix epigloea TaxID=1892477 RepID=A0ABP0DYU8_9PEZI
MRHRRIVMDSDDDMDDFISLQPASQTSTSVSISPKRAPARTPKHLKTASADTSATLTTTVRRRKLGRINNDASLLRSWRDSGHMEKRLLNGSDIPSIDLPHQSSPEPARRKPRIELRIRRTRRISELPADDEGELSTEEASVLEQVEIDGEDSVGSFSNAKVRYDEEQSSSRQEPYSPKGNREKGQEIDKKEETESDSEKSATVEGEETDDDEDNKGDSDSDTAEFQSSSGSDSSSDSLGDFFARTPSRRLAASRKDLQAPKEKDASSLTPEKTTNLIADEESSVFFSAEESLSDSHSVARLAPPLQQNLQPPTSRAKTPPLELSDQLRVSRLTSPKKRLPRIPQTPHLPSTDEFWDQLVVDDWNTEHSPRKLLFGTSDANASKQSRTAKDQATSRIAAKKSTTATRSKDAKKMFQSTKHELAEKFLAELDNTITDGQLSRLAAATGGVQIQWTNKLNTTAGRANWRRETLRPKIAAPATQAEPGTTTGPSSTATTAARVHHHASIELAEKVIDDEHRLLNVIAHEFCHLANFMVSGVTGNPHGKEFKAWAAKCSRQFGNRGIQVTTKHAYEIDFKYVWTCDACATEFKRHSRSIDPARHRCGACKGALKQTKPVPRGGGAKSASGAGVSGSGPSKGPSEYQKFMKEHMAIVRRENPDSPQKVIMTLVADRWTKAKEHKKAASTLATGATANEAGNEEVDACVDNLGRALVDLTLS